MDPIRQEPKELMLLNSAMPKILHKKSGLQIRDCFISRGLCARKNASIGAG
jgi:hypothetical protein